MMTTKLLRCGNSTGLRLPAAVLSAAGLRAGSLVTVRLLDSGDIRVRPLANLQATDVSTYDESAVLFRFTEDMW
jgi:antitoxin MazE